MRLRELAYSEEEVREYIQPRDIEDMIQEYREKGGYTDETV